MKKLLSGIFILACGATWVQADIKYPLFRAFPPIKNPAVSGVCIIFKTGHTKKCLTVFPLHNHFAKRVVRVVRAVFPLKIFIVHHFAHFLLGGIIRLYIFG